MADPRSPQPAAERPREPWGSWGALIGQACDPVFLLSRRRQIRYVNHAWEMLTGKAFETIRGSFCLPRKKKGTGPLRALLQALAPPPEAMAGRPVLVRRPAPPHRLGPPWWEIIFVPLRDADGLTGIVGHIRPITATATSGSTGNLTEALAAFRQRAVSEASFDLLTSDNVAMQRVQAQARLAATLKSPVWISGEAGTGKETLARIIHFNGVTREQTIVGIDCAGLQPFLVRNMLFGLSGQAGVQLGTVYLKNPEALARELQSELLEWYEEQDDPPRIAIGSRNRGGPGSHDERLLDEFATTFGVLEIHLPGLRDRAADIPRLASDLLLRETAGNAIAGELAPDALDCLSRHSWPGNLLELVAVLRSAVSSSGTNRIESSHLPLYIRSAANAPPRRPMPKLDDVLESVEARLIRQVLAQTKGNKSEAADLLGIPRARLLRRMETLKISDSSAHASG